MLCLSGWEDRKWEYQNKVEGWVEGVEVEGGKWGGGILRGLGNKRINPNNANQDVQCPPSHAKFKDYFENFSCNPCGGRIKLVGG